MRKHNPESERIKRRYFEYLKEAKRHSEASIDVVAKAISRFETYNKFRDFKAFNVQQAIGFKKHLAAQRAVRTGKTLSKATQHTTLNALRGFFLWMAGQPGFRSRLSYSDADYFSLSEKDTRIAKAAHEQQVPTLEQVHAVLDELPAKTDIERRDRTLIAFILLTGARDGAVASLKVKHVDMARHRVIFDAREVRTKFSKTFSTTFFPVGGDAERIVTEWVEYLIKDLLYGPDDPLFPSTRVETNEDMRFAPVGLKRAHWSSAEQFGVSSSRVSSVLAFLTLALTVSGRPSRCWASVFAERRKSSKHGARTWGTKK